MAPAVTPASTPCELSTDRLTFPHRVDNAVDNLWSELARAVYFHCVETPKPAAMKPNPTTMFQLSKLWIGRSPSVT